MLRRSYPDQIPPTGAREASDRTLTGSPFDETPGTTPELARELKMRLSPFFAEDNLIEYTFQARSEPGYPLTALSLILPYTEHPNHLVLAENDLDGVPPLWVDSILGGSYHEQAERIQACGVEIERSTLGTANLFQLMTAELGRGNVPLPAIVTSGPFGFSMVALSEYRSTAEHTSNSPAVVVAGSTLKDFALYFGLSRVRPGVCWFLPAWLGKFKVATTLNAHDSADAARLSEQPASVIASVLLNVLSSRRIENIDFVSASLGSDQLAAIIDDLSAISPRTGSTIKSRGRVPEGISHLLTHPRVVFNRDNFAVPTTQQILEGKAAGFFPTPKPKGFTRIVPYDHRWITELRVDGLSYPRHPALEVAHQAPSAWNSRFPNRKRGPLLLLPKRCVLGRRHRYDPHPPRAPRAKRRGSVPETRGISRADVQPI